MIGKRATSKSLFVILILILLVSLSYKAQQVLGQSGSSTINNPASNFLTYTNTDYGFTLKYPPDWTVHENKSLSDVKFISPDGIGVVVVTKSNLGENETGMSTDDMAKWLIRQLPKLKLFELNSNNYFLSGRPAIRVIGLMSYETSQFEFPQLKGMEFFTTLGQNAYDVLYGSTPEKFPDYLQTVQPMIDSFQIISKVG